jgi:O-antigen/teichoic acid export membrane protein
MLVQSADFGEAGLFEAAYQWKVAALFIPGVIGQILFPVLSNVIGKKNTNAYWKILKYNLYINAGISLLIAVVIALCGGFLMKLYGSDFTDVRPLIALAFSTVFASVASVAGISIASRAKMWTGFGFNAFWAIMLVFFTYLFLQKGLGAFGLSLAVLCSYIIHALLQCIYIYVLMSKLQ